MTEVSVWDQIADPLGQQLADDLRDMARAYESSRERNQQTRDNVVGPSGIGNPCTRCLARQVLGIPIARQFDDPWCRIIGTAVHAWLEKAALHSNTTAGEEWWLAETRVHPHPDALPRGGSADLYDRMRKTVIDHKIVGAEPLRKYRINGPGIQYRRQAHLYGLGHTRAGNPVEHVAVAFWQRGGRLSDLFVWTEPYDPQIALDAITRYRTIKDQAEALGSAILPLLPADESCWDCGGKDVSADELAVTQPNPIQGGSA